MMELKFDAFERIWKIEISDILDPRFAAEAIIAHQNFRSIFAICSIFSAQIARDLIFPKNFENSGIDAHHTSKWANSDRISLMWFKLKSERSHQKQHFFSHFKQFQLKMRCKSWICCSNFWGNFFCSPQLLILTPTFLPQLFDFQILTSTFVPQLFAFRKCTSTFWFF